MSLCPSLKWKISIFKDFLHAGESLEDRRWKRFLSFKKMIPVVLEINKFPQTQLWLYQPVEENELLTKGHSLWRACVQIQFLNSLYAPFVFSIFFLYHPYDAVDTTYILSYILYSVSLKNHLYMVNHRIHIFYLRIYLESIATSSRNLRH